MESILQIGIQSGIPVIEDYAQAVGASYKSKRCGTLGKINACSFYPVKNLDAIRFEELTYREVIEKNIEVMDLTAITLCMDNNLPVVVFNLNKTGNIFKAVMGESIGTHIRG